MAESAATVSRWSRRFVVASAIFLVGWQIAVLLGTSQRLAIRLAVHGFVVHVILGKGFALLPAYFDRELALPFGPPVTFALTTTGVGSMLLSEWHDIAVLGAVGATLWLAGVVAFATTIVWTVRDNPTGGETGTSDANAERTRVDRIANAFVPIAILYLLAGAVGTVGWYVPAMGDLGWTVAQGSHLLAAGTGALLVFAIGHRLIPRFLAVPSPNRSVSIVLPAGAIGPGVIAIGMTHPEVLPIGALLEGVAMVAFALTYAVLYHRSDRRRVGFHGPLLGAAAGCGGVLLGAWFAIDGRSTALVTAHYRLNVLGFLGLTIVGLAYQFYPPSIGTFRGATDRVALGSILALGGGLGLEVVGLVAGIDPATTVGRLGTLAGALVYTYLLIGLFHER